MAPDDGLSRIHLCGTGEEEEEKWRLKNLSRLLPLLRYKHTYDDDETVHSNTYTNDETNTRIQYGIGREAVHGFCCCNTIRELAC